MQDEIVAPDFEAQGGGRITAAMLTLVELGQRHIDAIVKTVPGGESNVQDIYPLSPLQQGMLFHRLLNQTNDTYVLSTLFELESRTQLALLIGAIETVIGRHDALRSAILWEELPRPVHVVHAHTKLPVEEVFLDRHRDVYEQLREWIQPTHWEMELQHAPLLKLKFASDPHAVCCYAVLQVHHLICDHQSLRVLVAEIMACIDGREQSLPAPISFRQHIEQALAQPHTEDGTAFFGRKLADVEEPTAPFGLVEAHGDGSHIEEATLTLDSATAGRLRTQARRYGVTAARLFHSAWALVVAHTTGRSDVVFGTVVRVGRHSAAGMERMLGMAANTLPLRLRLQDLTTRQLIEHTGQELSEVLRYEQVSLADAQRCSGMRGAPLFTALLNFRRSIPERDGDARIDAAGVRVLGRGEAWTNYPITMTVDDLGEAFRLTAHADRRIGATRLTELLEVAAQSLVHALERTPESPALSIFVLPESERRSVVDVFNATQATHANRDKSIHELFEQQAWRTPTEVAVVCEGQSLTYAELNRKANRLARYLQSKGIGSDELVGICVGRTLEMIVGLLGILKAGGAYVPLDPNYPSERLAYMLGDAAPRIVLTQAEVRAMLPVTQAEVIELESSREQIEKYSDENLAPKQEAPESLVYVIYTSGSTGRPKGTAMAHRSMVNLIEWHRATFGQNERARVLQFAALSFDVAFQEVFSTLCTGGTLVLLHEWTRKDVSALTEFLRDASIERLFLPPLMLQNLAQHFSATGLAPSDLKDVIVAGEQLVISPEIVRLFNQLAGCRLHNHYGPTETHVVTSLTLSGRPDAWPTLPAIGRPISNTQIYILDAQRRPVAVGVPGEIFIAGANVARGYLLRPELTEERFLPIPFSGDPQARMYRTGDQGRWCADGTIEYLGRNDDQVKIRGYRIELGEIEAHLGGHPQVKERAVVVRSDSTGGKRLVAYVTPRERGCRPTADELRVYLKGALPDFMVPSAFVMLEALPVTPSGKVDRRSLPTPDLDVHSSVEHERPRGETEELLAGIWQELLGVARVGRHDNFFEIGGHSLLAMQVIARLQSAYSLQIPMKVFVDNPSLQQMSARIGELRQARVREVIAPGGTEMEELLQTIVSMPEGRVAELVRELRAEGRL